MYDIQNQTKFHAKKYIYKNKRVLKNFGIVCFCSKRTLKSSTKELFVLLYLFHDTEVSNWSGKRFKSKLSC